MPEQTKTLSQEAPTADMSRSPISRDSPLKGVSEGQKGWWFFVSPLPVRSETDNPFRASLAQVDLSKDEKPPVRPEMDNPSGASLAPADLSEEEEKEEGDRSDLWVLSRGGPTERDRDERPKGGTRRTGTRSKGRRRGGRPFSSPSPEL